MVRTPDEYRWSSYLVNAWGKNDSLVVPHEVYLRAGMSVEDRTHYYRGLFKFAIPDEDVHQIRRSVNQNYPTGNERFKRQVEAALGRKLGTGLKGRPRSN